MDFLSSVVNRCLDRLSSRFETGYLSVDCAIGSSALLLPTLAARATAHGGKVDGLVDGLDHRFHRPSAWGRFTYVDGFGNDRWTNFCHRYNTEVKEAQIGGGSRIRKEYGRHHEYGNDAN